MTASLTSNTDLDARNQTIADLFAISEEQLIYLPIHNQVLNWGMSENINFDVQPEDQPHFQFLTFN